MGREEPRVGQRGDRPPLTAPRRYVALRARMDTCSVTNAYTVKILVVILTTIPRLIFITTLSSRPLDDTVVTHVISIGNWNLRDESVVTNDDRVVN